MTERTGNKRNHPPIILTQKELEMINKMWLDQNRTTRKEKRELLRRQR